MIQSVGPDAGGRAVNRSQILARSLTIRLDQDSGLCAHYLMLCSGDYGNDEGKQHDPTQSPVAKQRLCPNI